MERYLLRVLRLIDIMIVFKIGLIISPIFFVLGTKADVPVTRFHILYFDSYKGHKHQLQVHQILSQCSGCLIQGFEIYDHKGILTEKRFVEQLDVAQRRAKKGSQNDFFIFHFSWNMPASDKTKVLENRLNQLTKEKCFNNGHCWIVAAGGEVLDDTFEDLQIDHTVMGKTEKVWIIGELDSRQRMPIRAYYGAKVYTAVAPPRGLYGSSFSSALFTVALAEYLMKPKNHLGLVQKMDSIKKKKEFPTLLDVFNGP